LHARRSAERCMFAERLVRHIIGTDENEVIMARKNIGG
jgi:hypothetical protein